MIQLQRPTCVWASKNLLHQIENQIVSKERKAIRSDQASSCFILLWLVNGLIWAIFAELPASDEYESNGLFYMPFLKLSRGRQFEYATVYELIAIFFLNTMQATTSTLFH